MSTSLLTGASGLLSHQRKLNIVANNLANMNTEGFKSQRILFSDLLYTTIQPAASGTDDQFGGTNPRQTGFGTSVASTGRDFSQGVLSSTGQVFDFAIEGNGFFVVNDGEAGYTRVGAFSLDANGFLVNPANGAFVQRTGNIGEGDDGNPAFQSADSLNIRIPIGTSIPGKETNAATFAGNLPATAIGPLPEILDSTIPFLEGGVAATGATLLNDLDINVTDYVGGDFIEMSYNAVDGTAGSFSFAVDGTTTMNDLVNTISAQFAGATASLNTDGTISITADAIGEAELTFRMEDNGANTGRSELGLADFITSQEGKVGDIVQNTIQIFDLRGEPHEMVVSFQKQSANVWDAAFSLLNESGVLLDENISQIEFTENGLFRTVNGIGLEDSNIEIQFDGLTNPQTISFDFANVTHLANSASLNFDQDGYPPGSLVSVTADPTGRLDGIATNGQRIPVAQMAIATFINQQGLEAAGQNVFRPTANSGVPVIGAGLSGAAGTVRGGQLESSNVDVALEFTQLIVAQRGFSANARTITVASEVLEELTNIVR